MTPDKVTILATGDVMPDRPNPNHLFDLAKPTLDKADIRVGQLEAVLSELGERQLHMTPPRKIPAAYASSLAYAGFDIMTFASNHHLDRGEAAFFETLDTIRKLKIAVIGVGKNIEEARKPLIVEKKGNRIGFLDYCSVLPKGYEAGPNKSGCAPMRVSTYYEQVDWQPGTPPRIITVPNKEDLAAMVDDIKKLRPQVDVLVMSIHWGLHFVPALIAQYQPEVGHAAIDAGADVIIGNHAHILKGTEVYKGKVIFYSLCNFVLPSSTNESLGSKFYGLKHDPDYPDYKMPFDSRKSGVAKLVVENRKLARVTFLPLYINKFAQPEFLNHKDERFGQVVDYMRSITESAGLNSKYAADGDEVVITA